MTLKKSMKIYEEVKVTWIYVKIMMSILKLFQVCVLLHNKISSLVYNNTFVNVRLYLKYSSTTHTYTYTHMYINIFMYI